MLRALVLRRKGYPVIAAAERGAWQQLEAKLRPFVARRVTSPADVDDVVQDTLLRIERGVTQLRDDQRFGPWVYRVARSAIVDHRRSAARHPLASAEVPEQADVEESDELARDELAGCIAPFVAALPSPYREALTLTELEGMTQRDAAAMLGISLSGMKSRVQRGRRLLRRSLEQCCHIALDARGGVMDWQARPDGCVPSRCGSGLAGR